MIFENHIFGYYHGHKLKINIESRLQIKQVLTVFDIIKNNAEKNVLLLKGLQYKSGFLKTDFSENLKTLRL